MHKLHSMILQRNIYVNSFIKKKSFGKGCLELQRISCSAPTKMQFTSATNLIHYIYIYNQIFCEK